MTDDVQREIEENQARVRDTEDVGLDEDYVNDRDGSGNFILDATDDLFNPDDDGPNEREHEFDDNTKSTG